MISVFKKRVEKPQCEMSDEEFSGGKEALAFACATYKIKKCRLSQLYFDNDESFDRAFEGPPEKLVNGFALRRQRSHVRIAPGVPFLKDCSLFLFS